MLGRRERVIDRNTEMLLELKILNMLVRRLNHILVMSFGNTHHIIGVPVQNLQNILS